MARKPWDGWYHIMGNTFGTWLHGDPRGWHTRHHREHIQGDYKSPPPPEDFKAKHEHSKRLMTRPPIVLSWSQRVLACRVFGEAMLFYNAEVAALCMGSKHFHLLARFVNCDIKAPTPGRGGRSGGVRAFDIDPKPRLIVGRVKSWTTKQLKEAGHFIDHDGGLWGKRPQVVPVKGAGHHAFLRDDYIPKHRDEGAAVWGEL